MGVSEVNYLQKKLEIALMSTIFFYNDNLPYKSRFSNGKLLQQQKHQKQK